MLAPRLRPRRHSPAPASSPPTSESIPDFRWSDTDTERERMTGPSRSSTRTSVSNWSDDKTEIPQVQEEQGVKEGKLIDFDDDDENDQDVPNPTQKLRELLREMEKQAREAVPTPSTETTGVGKWDRRRTFTDRLTSDGQDEDAGGDSDSSDSSLHHGQEREAEDGHAQEEEEEEEEEQSPPTPPPRIGNPYSGRTVSAERRSPSLAQPGRLPSRAAVLLHSTSRSPPPEAAKAPSPSLTTTPLQAFLASHSEPSSSTNSKLNLSRTSSTSSSRKGKERAISPLQDVAETSASRRNRFRLQHQQYQQTLQHQPPNEGVDPPRYPKEVQPTPTREQIVYSPPIRDFSTSIQPTPAAATKNRRRGGTPRRMSVDLAPDDSASFVRGLTGESDVQMEMELDLDEGFSRVGWEDNSTIASGSAVSPIEQQHQITREVSVDDRTAKRTASLRRSVSPQLPTPPPTVSARYSQPQKFTSQEMRSKSQPRPRSRETSIQEDQPSSTYPYSTSRSRSRNSPSQTFHSTLSVEQERDRTPPLPTLPEPDSSADDHDHDLDTYASRRAALFRSSSRSASASSTSRGSTNTPSFRTANKEESSILPPRRYSPIARNSVTPSPAKISPSRLVENSSLRSSGPRYARDIHIPPQEPIQVGFTTTTTALTTPISQKVSPSHKPIPDVSMNMPTPRPPGAWGTPLHTQKSKVRFSPLRQEVQILNQVKEVEWEEGHSIHRLRMSPRKSPKKGSPASASVKEKEVDEPIDPDTSWTARLSRSLSKARISIPARSTTLSLAQRKLDEAAQNTREAQAKVELTQRQWLEALTRAGEIGVGSVRRGWNLGYWAWWVLMEVVLLWGVFRVTIDYATSTRYMTSFDPFHPLSTPIGHQGGLLSVGLPVPAGISTFVNKSGVGSGNFFDLLEAWGVWTLGAGAGANAGGGGMRMLGGVPS